MGPVYPVGQDGIEKIGKQARLSRAGDPSNYGQNTQRETSGDSFQVVLGGSPDSDRFAVARPPDGSTLDRQSS